MAEEYVDISLSGYENEDASEEPFVYDEEAGNLVQVFESHPVGLQALQEISQFVIEKTREAEESSDEYRQRLADDNRLLTGELKPKDFPFQHCANGNIPILLENTTRLHARLYAELFGDWTAIVGVVPIGPDDEEIAESMSLHDNWQFREDIPDFQRQIDRQLMMFLFSGDVSCHSYYDHQRKKNTHETLNPDSLFVPFAMTSVYPDYSDVPYLVKLLRYYRHDLQRMRGAFEHVGEVLAREPAWDDEPDQVMGQEASQVQGIYAPDGDKYCTPYTLYHFEGWCSKLPNQEKDRYIQAIVDPFTQHILSLKVHEEVSWKDRAKERQMAQELAQYREAKGRADEARAMQDQAFVEDAVEMVATSAGVEEAAPVQAATQIVIPDPDPPAWLDDPENPPEEPPRFPKTPIHMFTHGVNIEPLAGALGIGYGRIQADFTRAANTAVNQFIDSKTLDNCPMTFTSAHLPPDMEFVPGKFNKVDIPAEDLAKSFFVVPKPQADPGLVQFADMMYKYAQSSVQAPDVLSGAPGKSGETFRGISSRIEQATKQLSTTGRKFANFFTHIVRNNARLNSYFLDETQLVRVLDYKIKQHRDVTINRSMYERDYRVELRADLRFTTETQKQQEAMQTVEMTTQLPALQMNFALQHKAITDLFKAMNREDLVPLLGAAPPAPQQFGPPAPPMAPPGVPGAPPGGPPPGEPQQ